MTDQEINTAIAKACGWLKQMPCPTCGHGTHKWLTPDWLIVELLPNYCADLNAMHEAEGTLKEPNRTLYLNQLYDPNEDKPDAEWLQVHATARQRAEAFLKTLNLWRGE